MVTSEKTRQQPSSRSIMKRLITCFLAGLLVSTSAFAQAPDERLKDPALEAKAREISKGLRCLVCQNQSIDDSDADLAKDLRRIVRERLLAGDDEAAIEDYLVSRYGEFVLLKPRLNTSTILLWGSPLLFVLMGVGFAGFAFRRRESLDTPQDKAPQEGLSTSLKHKTILDQLRDN